MNDQLSLAPPRAASSEVIWKPSKAFNLFAEDILQVWQVSMLLTAQLPNRSDTLYRKVDSIEDTNTDMREVLEQLQERLYRLEHPGKTH